VVAQPHPAAIMVFGIARHSTAAMKKMRWVVFTVSPFMKSWNHSQNKGFQEHIADSEFVFNAFFSMPPAFSLKTGC
jgi:hypothetical protein